MTKQHESVEMTSWVWLLEKVRWRFSVFSSSWWRSSWLRLRREAVRHSQNLIWRSAVWEGRWHSNTSQCEQNKTKKLGIVAFLPICQSAIYSSSLSPAAPDCPAQGFPRRSFVLLRGRVRMLKWGRQLTRSTTTQVGYFNQGTSAWLQDGVWRTDRPGGSCSFTRSCKGVLICSFFCSCLSGLQLVQMSWRIHWRLV